MKVVFLDSETTGNGPKDRICQLGIVIANSKLEIEEGIEELVKPPVPISIEAMSIHHITPEKVVDAPPIRFTRGWKRLKELNSPENILIIHNAQYDLEMLSREGFNSHFRLIDTFRILKHLFPESRYGLQYNRYYLGLYQQEEKILNQLRQKGIGITLHAHSALADSVVLYMLVKFLVEKKGVGLEEMVKLTQKPIIYDRFFFGKYKFKPIREVLLEDPEYVERLLEEEQLEEDWQASILYHLERFTETPIYRFQIGKYRGMTPEDVAQIDLDYLRWAYFNMGGISKGFRKRLKEILQREGVVGI